MTEIVGALDKQKVLRGESSIMQKWTEKQIKSDELRLRDELLHRTSMDIKDGIQKVAMKVFGSKKWTIYRVDRNLKKLHDEATFHPKLVAIGPFHHNKSDHLKPMEDHKWRFLSRFLNSMKHYDHYREIDQTMKIQFLVAKMEKLENEVRACYSETFDDLGSKEFVMMMVLDGCFIIELLILFEKSEGRPCMSGDDPIFSSRSVMTNLMHDLLLLENQLPFEVLKGILELKVLGRQYNLTDLILKFFNTFMLFREKKVLDASRQVITKIPYHHHLLALFRSSFQTGNNYYDSDYCEEPVARGKREQTLTTVSDRQPIQSDVHVKDQPAHQILDMWIHCVTELREAGVEFKKRDNHHHDLLEIEFKGGKLYIPTLYIDDSTSSVFLNFIAYEQHNHSIKPNFTSYLMFLDSLVNSSKDVEHLRHKRIIDHLLGSCEDVATMFHKICKDVVHDFGDDNYLSQVFQDVNKYFGKRRNRWRATWKQEYFRNPWAFSSFIAAVILLVLTFLQTFFSMYAYFHPPS